MNEKVSKEIQSYTINKGFFLYALKKTERLTRALYLITNFFPESEPLRWRLREESLGLLDYFSCVADSSGRSSSTDVSFVKRSLELSLASLGVAHTAGLISEMNFSILRSEYEGLLRMLLDELESDGSHSPLLFPQDFFAVERTREEGGSRQRYLYSATFNEEEVTQKHAIQKPRALRLGATEAGGENERDAKTGAEPARSKGHFNTIKDIKDTKRTNLVGQSRSQDEPSRTSRREVILQLVKDKKEITVKDAAREIREFSEKTLQRELFLLVSEGVLERVGSRRWSKYRFA